MYKEPKIFAESSVLSNNLFLITSSAFDDDIINLTGNLPCILEKSF